MNTFLKFFLVLVLSQLSTAQNTPYWQQQADYVMEVDMDVHTFQYRGTQKLTYTNNSPDTLEQVYYHLYFNAFQPNSAMDIRLQQIKDPDLRMVDNTGTDEAPVYQSRIARLQPEQQGFLKVLSLKQDGVSVRHHTEGTLLVVHLHRPISPDKKTVFEMDFLGQVPEQIRRSGRNNKEGVALSMTQWYPKLAAYDFEGWHTEPYIAREFYGVWGRYDVTLRLDKNYVVGGTGSLQNPQEVGHGYQSKNQKLSRPKGNRLTWHFIAPKVHDFAWAADPEFQHDVLETETGTKLHFLYKKNLPQKYRAHWKALPSKTEALMNYYNTQIGQYPYPQYSVIQGGDGGMEYGMCTLITAARSFESLVGVVAHELAHSWFQFVLANNESKYPWMDEGFATYISNLAHNHVSQQGKSNPNAGAYSSYLKLREVGVEEPLSTHSDAYRYNYAYGAGVYGKGAVFLAQLGYVIGTKNLEKTLQKYYQDFQFKHPTPNDFKRSAEKTSGIFLDWYFYHWLQTTHAIDYKVTVEKDRVLVLEQIGDVPMPLDVLVTYSDGRTEDIYIPLACMRGEKPTKATKHPDWPETARRYRLVMKKEIASVIIDPFQRMADVNRSDNEWQKTLRQE